MTKVRMSLTTVSRSYAVDVDIEEAARDTKEHAYQLTDVDRRALAENKMTPAMAAWAVEQA